MNIDNKLNFVVKDIVNAKKFSNLEDRFVLGLVKRISLGNKKIVFLFENKEYSEFKKNQIYKNFIKEVRKILHDVYSVYQIKDIDKREKIFDLMKKTKNRERLLDLHKEILHCHTSSRERKNFYSEIYEKIFQISGKPKKILDFGCGINPFSIPFMNVTGVDYFACDFVLKDVYFLQNYFDSFSKIYDFKGKSFCVDVFDKDFENVLKNTNNVDVCLLFKMTDVLDYFENGHKGTERFIENVRSKCVVVSFPIKTVSGKTMRSSRRRWFELMLNRKGYLYEEFSVENEFFYVVNKIEC